MNLKKIGKVIETERGFAIELDEQYKKGLTSLDGFSHLNILWYADKSGDDTIYDGYVIDKPYKKGPGRVGVFATRSQIRPNPIGTTIIGVSDVDYEKGIIYTYYIDAFPGTPVLDIKPYLPASDVVREYTLPKWCTHWPKSTEESGSFNWEEEFNF